ASGSKRSPRSAPRRAGFVRGRHGRNVRAGRGRRLGGGAGRRRLLGRLVRALQGARAGARGGDGREGRDAREGGRRRVRRRALAADGRRVAGGADAAAGCRVRRRSRAAAGARGRRLPERVRHPARARRQRRPRGVARADGEALRRARARASACRAVPAQARNGLVLRLNAWLARAGVASRRGADELIKAGRVTVNGDPGRLNTFVQAHDVVRLDGRELAKQQVAYVLLHKPAGVVTTARDPQGRRTVVDLVDHPSRVVPVGRLDVDTTGALLLTNDGDLSHRLAHPRYEVDKVYEVECWTQPTDTDLQRLREGVELDDGPTRGADVRRIDGARIELTIHEGRNR